MPWFPTIKTPSTHYFLHISLLILSLCLISTSDGLKNFTCIDQERDALLKFKQHIEYDLCGFMDSWGNSDCCTWDGVSCNNRTGHVIGIHLGGEGGPFNCNLETSKEIGPSLGELKHLEYLDLSSNYFHNKVMLSSIGSLVNLRHLNLSYSYLSGEIPNQLGNLTRLVSLDLSNNYGGLYSKSLNWLLPLTLLRNINLGGTNLMTATDWFQTIVSLPLLEVIKMDWCGLFYVDLSNNQLQGPIPNDFGKLPRLVHLDLSSNHLEGLIPSELGDLRSISHIDLSNNQLQGPIPNDFGKLSRLVHLDLSSNHLEGLIPRELGDSQSISYIDLSNNHLQGPIPLYLKQVEYLDLSTNRLSGYIPCRFWYSQSFRYVNFSSNNLSGPVPNYEYHYQAYIYDFDGNHGLHFVELPSMCEEDDKDEDKIYYIGLYVSLGVGFYTGFWAFCGILTLKNSWRHAYFQFLDHMANKIYVTVAIYLAKYRRKSQV